MCLHLKMTSKMYQKMASLDLRISFKNVTTTTVENRKMRGKIISKLYNNIIEKYVRKQPI